MRWTFLSDLEVVLSGTNAPIFLPMSLPQLKQFSFNGIEVQLWVPGTRRPSGAASAQSGTVAAPYWARLWPSALALSRHIAAHPELVDGKQVLELAAGLGLPGIVAAHAAATVTISDYMPEAVAQAQLSVRANGLSNVRCDVLDWNELPPDLEAEVLLLSDVNYEPAAFDTLHKVLLQFLRKGVTILLATPQRLMAKPFIERLLSYCQSRAEELIMEQEGPSYISIFVLQGRD